MELILGRQVPRVEYMENERQGPVGNYRDKDCKTSVLEDFNRGTGFRGQRWEVRGLLCEDVVRNGKSTQAFGDRWKEARKTDYYLKTGPIC